MLEHDVIIGGGLAGCRGGGDARLPKPECGCGCHPIRSHQSFAQGGIAATLKNVDSADSWEAAFDTVKAPTTWQTKMRLKFSPAKLQT